MATIRNRALKTVINTYIHGKHHFTEAGNQLLIIIPSPLLINEDAPAYELIEAEDYITEALLDGKGDFFEAFINNETLAKTIMTVIWSRSPNEKELSLRTLFHQLGNRNALYNLSSIVDIETRPLTDQLSYLKEIIHVYALKLKNIDSTTMGWKLIAQEREMAIAALITPIVKQLRVDKPETLNQIVEFKTIRNNNFLQIITSEKPDEISKIISLFTNTNHIETMLMHAAENDDQVCAEKILDFALSISEDFRNNLLGAKDKDGRSIAQISGEKTKAFLSKLLQPNQPSRQSFFEAVAQDPKENTPPHHPKR